MALRHAVATALFGPSPSTAAAAAFTAVRAEGPAGATSRRERAPADHFRRVPQFWPSLEFFFLFGALVLIDVTLSTVLLPLRLALAPQRASKRDLVSLALVFAGLGAFLFPTEAKLYSYFYHFIRASSMLKLYVIFNMLEVAEKLLCSLISDACEALGNALRPHGGPHDRVPLLFIVPVFAVAAVGVAAHSLVLLLHVITINVAINSQGSSLFALLVSNNFLEVKSAVFKRFTTESLFQVAMGDAVERFQYIIFVAVMLGQHAQSEGFGTVEPLEILLIFGCEVFIDSVKHLFVSRFNGIHLGSYDYFTHTLMLDVARERFMGGLRVPILATPTAAASLHKAGVLRPPHPISHEEVLQSTSAGDAPPGSSSSNNDGNGIHISISSGSSGGGGCPAVIQRLGFAGEPPFSDPWAFVPQPARRAAFAPFSYVALLMWQFSPVLWRFIRRDHASLALLVGCVVAAKLLSATLVGGLSLRFACRSMLRDERALFLGRRRRPHNLPSPPPQAAGGSGAVTPALTSPAVSAAAAPRPFPQPAAAAAAGCGGGGGAALAASDQSADHPAAAAAAAGLGPRRATMPPGGASREPAAPPNAADALFGVSPVGFGMSAQASGSAILRLLRGGGGGRAAVPAVPPADEPAAAVPPDEGRHDTAVASETAGGGGAALAGRAGGALRPLPLCIVLDDLQASLFSVDRFDNRAGKNK